MVTIFTAYRFVELDDRRVAEIRTELSMLAEREGLLGLVILGNEGVNFTMAAEHLDQSEIPILLQSIPEFKDLDYKYSQAETSPFKKFLVKIRAEIVSMQRADVFPQSRADHIKPAQWRQLLASGEPVTLIDTRNNYEVEVGTFKDALNPQLNTFAEFSDYLRQSDLPKSQKTMIFCTGGIRCEKAIIEMKEQGFGDVVQLDGGILKYLEEFPDDQFYQGECFVFDHRVAVDGKLKPSQEYVSCPHCGNPGNVEIACKECQKAAVVCKHCIEKSAAQSTCSRNCAHHYDRKN